jgi:phospholipase A-2-activating protein
VRTFFGHSGTITGIDFNNELLASSSSDGTAKVWDSASGELRHTLEAGSHAVALGVLPTGEVVTGSQDKTLRVFRGGDLVSKVDDAHGDVIRCIAASSSHLVTCSNDMMLKMWSFDGCEMGVISGHTSFVYNVTHSVDGKQLISSSDDCTVKLWSLSDLSCSQSLLHAATVWQAAVLPNGDIASACEDSIVRIWTADPERMAPEAERQTQKEIAENAAVQARAKGSDSTPVPDALDISQMPTTVGKKNGEIKCFKEGGKVSAYSWNAGNQAWDCIGEVVGSPDVGKKVNLQG